METFIHEYKGFGGCQSMCKVYHVIKDSIHHFCFEDMGVGTSVTNMSEYLANGMVMKYDLSPLHCRFFESYVDLNDQNSRTLDEITYFWDMRIASNPDWKPAEEINFFDFQFKY